MRSIEQAFDGGGAALPRAAGRSGPARRPVRPARPARLTRRGRIVVVLMTLLLLVLAGFSLGRVSSQAAGPSRPLPTVTVKPGETLWQIAAQVAPSGDRRAVVAQIEQLNGIGDGRVTAGQQLRLPR